ncbi:MAG: ATP-grasp domain-containing protein [Rhodospirillaceae bacterium]|nr:ATP-grasp domain-containing protein [Rhodospirillaceae bacterium]MBT5080766.1 ATP-grasp domain-containing protein [Rhodospirillaceae bacterium]MBT5525188.1 ATP-grasp domain-containing protein [Rhodospirillaceae bacterium]MBT5877757.1 ATP-grasp domain-containing protein [Rhodospirillaceae bacterium]MBT7977971.1 ATP-grasp domain-containing protein [Rhodospirillaceae bacterium]
MSITKLLIANRGEIAIRVQRAAAALDIPTVAIYSEDDAQSLHVFRADKAHSLAGVGAQSYLDIDLVIAAAKATGCDGVHPGYGFLSENAAFARACEDAGLCFVGPSPDVLEKLGDKVKARNLAAQAGIPVLSGSMEAVDLAGAQAFRDELQGGALIIKAVSGGGGRGVRVVGAGDDLEAAVTRAASEAAAAFGDGSLYVERYLPRARHIEVQIIGDAAGNVRHLGERDCSIQRRHQKILEIAPAPGLDKDLRTAILDAAVTLAQALEYTNLGTFEFLVDSARGDFVFMEANPRLQVEHTVTEEVTGVDLVRAQLRIAAGASLDDLAIPEAGPEMRGTAVQARVNMERMDATGAAMPAGGQLTAFDPPTGPGIRTDTFGYAGYTTTPRFDSLLAKVITHSDEGYSAAIKACYRALCEFRIEGVANNIGFLQNLLQHEAITKGDLYTQFIDEHVAELIDGDPHKTGYLTATPVAERQLAGAQVANNDPLAVLSFGQSGATADTATVPSVASPTSTAMLGPDGSVPVLSPLQGTIVAINVDVDDGVTKGAPLLVMESMKMEHVIPADISGFVRAIAVSVGDTIYDGAPLAFIEEGDVAAPETDVVAEIDLDEIRPDLAEVLDRRFLHSDAGRPKATARRHDKGQRTARENIAALCNMETFVEYAPLVLAAQRQRHDVATLIDKSPADGLITAIAAVNDDLFDEPENRCAIMFYDYTVFAGTQGVQNHRKTDRIIDLAEEGRLPFVLFAEGGGGRPGDTDRTGGDGSRTFSRFAQLSALVPMVGITTGRCFAGNASLLGCCDVIIATKDANIGMGGPAMIEGGGLGVFAPEEIGPMSIQVPAGVVDILVEDEAEAIDVAKKYLSYFQGPITEWEAPDQRLMRRIVPENRLRVYEIREVIETLADVDSVLELRPGFGFGAVTCLIRVEGRPVGVLANNPKHLGGAIDADASDKAARFMQLCDAFDIPLLNLCDTPGIMVGPEIEKTALVRHSSRMFLIGANLSVPFFTIVLRKGYGLGAIAMAGGSYKAAYFTVAWPTGEFYGMGIEGAVKLGYRNDLAAIEDPEERLETYQKMVDEAYEGAKALNYASYFGIDDTIDPAESRHWLINCLKSIRPKTRGDGKKRPSVDAW